MNFMPLSALPFRMTIGRKFALQSHAPTEACARFSAANPLTAIRAIYAVIWYRRMYSSAVFSQEKSAALLLKIPSRPVS